MLLPTKFLFVAFAATALAVPLTPALPTDTTPFNTTSTGILSPRAKDGICSPSKGHYPSMSMWEIGLNQFCTNYGDKPISSDAPLVMTLTLTGRDNKPIEWIYKITLHNVYSEYVWEWTPSVKQCKDKFMALTRETGGGLGKVYCKSAPNGEQSMLGGKYKQRADEGYGPTVTWRTRPKKGQKGI